MADRKHDHAQPHARRLQGVLDELWEFCEQFNADMVILWEHMSCKALDGMHGLFEERAREHGIHLVWVTHDLFDPRVVSRQGVRQQVNDYMRTVMQEEPVDPSLEILKDENPGNQRGDRT